MCLPQFSKRLTTEYFNDDRIRPLSTIPICVDVGTNNQAFLDDPFYLGLRQKRISEPEMDEFMDEFMHEMTQAFPKMMIQFEVSAVNVSSMFSGDPKLLLGFLYR